jgi:hypothetical protein
MRRTGVLELVRPDGMVPSRSSRRRDGLPWLDGDVGRHLELPPLHQHPCRHQERLRHARSCLQRSHRLGDLSVSLDSFLSSSLGANVQLISFPSLNGLHPPIDIHSFTNELTDPGSYSAGLLAAAFIGIAPGTALLPSIQSVEAEDSLSCSSALVP